MPRVKALNTNGEITWCTAKVPGHHVIAITSFTKPKVLVTNDFNKR